MSYHTIVTYLMVTNGDPIRFLRSVFNAIGGIFGVFGMLLLATFATAALIAACKKKRIKYCPYGHDATHQALRETITDLTNENKRLADALARVTVEADRDRVVTLLAALAGRHGPTEVVDRLVRLYERPTAELIAAHMAADQAAELAASARVMNRDGSAPDNDILTMTGEIRRFEEGDDNLDAELAAITAAMETDPPEDWDPESPGTESDEQDDLDEYEPVRATSQPAEVVTTRRTDWWTRFREQGFAGLFHRGADTDDSVLARDGATAVDVDKDTERDDWQEPEPPRPSIIAAELPAALQMPPSGPRQQTVTREYDPRVPLSLRTASPPANAADTSRTPNDAAVKKWRGTIFRSFSGNGAPQRVADSYVEVAMARSTFVPNDDAEACAVVCDYLIQNMRFATDTEVRVHRTLAVANA